MPALCPLCRWSASQLAIVAGAFVARLACRQGVPGAPLRTSCPVYQREPGADDDVRRGRWQIVGTAV